MCFNEVWKNEIEEKYLELINTKHFVEYVVNFTSKIQTGLKKGYNEGSREDYLVRIIEGIVNELGSLPVLNNGFKISTKSVFIHGRKSFVEFVDRNGKSVTRELGDLIFILSVIYNGKKYFEKLAISQFKKDVANSKGNKSGSIKWNLSNEEQLYLLSHFPSFRGANCSLIPKREFSLPNYSGCLGSYNLLISPGEFVFVCAPLLEGLLGIKKVIEIIDIYKLFELPRFCPIYPFPFNCDTFRKISSLAVNSLCCEIPVLFSPTLGRGVLGISRSAFNIYDFVNKYLRGYVGELIYSYVGPYNRDALDFLRELFFAIKKKAIKDNDVKSLELVNEFFKHPYVGTRGNAGENIPSDIEFDYEGGGFGIIYASINLGEG